TADGANWTAVTSPPDVFDLGAVACRSARRCLAAGSRNGDAGAVYATASGGRSWQLVPADLPGGLFLAISCATRDVCVAGGNEGMVFSTADAGQTWSTQRLTD